MASGPWDKYKQESGPWTKYAAPKTESVAVAPTTEESNVSYLESLLRGGAQGATFGFADELAGAGQAGLDAFLKGDTNLQDNYKKYRDESRKSFKEAEEANPKTSFSGSLIGSILPALVAAPAEAASLGGTALSGAKIGALTGLGSSTADLTQGDFSGAAKDVGLNAAVGSVLSPVIGGVAKALSSSTLLSNAANQAIKATGATKNQIKSLLKTGRLAQHGENLLNKNPYQDSPLVTAGASVDSILDKAQDLKEKSGQAIGDILTKLDTDYSVKTPELLKDFFNPTDAVAEIKVLQNQFVKNGSVVPLYQKEFNRLQAAMDTVSSFGDKPITFSEANQLKQLISKSAYNEDGKLSDELLGQVRGIINDGIETSADKVAQKLNDGEITQKYLQAKDLYRTAKDAENSALGKQASNIANKDLGITDYMSGIAGALAHGTPTGIAAIGLNKLYNKLGNTTLARVNKTAGDASRAIGNVLTKVPRDVLKSSGESLISSGDPIQTRLGRILIQASDRDDVGRNAVIFSLMQNPDYRDVLKSALEDKVK